MPGERVTKTQPGGSNPQRGNIRHRCTIFNNPDASCTKESHAVGLSVLFRKYRAPFCHYERYRKATGQGCATCYRPLRRVISTRGTALMHGGVGVLRHKRFWYFLRKRPLSTPNILLAIAFSVVYMAKYQYVMSRICLNISKFSKIPGSRICPEQEHTRYQENPMPNSRFRLEI